MLSKVRIFLIFVLLFGTLLFACKKAGPDGKARLNVRVFNYNSDVSGVKVYVKYGATESPGTSPSDYNASQTTDSNGRVIFNGLSKGDYFFYCAYKDSLTNKNYSGENTTNIDNNTGERDLVIRVDTL